MQTPSQTSSKTKFLKAGLLASSFALSTVVAGCNPATPGDASGGATLFGGKSSSTGAVVTVNGEAIDHATLNTQLEAVYGESGVRQLIDYALVMQKLKTEKMSVSDDEVNASIEARKATTPEIAQVLESKGARLTALQRQTRYQLALDKLMTKDVKATDDQIKKWFETRHKYYDTPAKAKVGILLTTSKVKADTMVAQLKSKSKSFVELVNAQKVANDPAARSSIAESPEMIPVDPLPPLLKNTINNLQPGQTSSVVTLQEGPRAAFAILRLVQKQPMMKADYAKMKAQVETDYKLEQIARKLNSQNPAKTPFDQTLVQVENAVRSQAGGRSPGMREILGFITQRQVTELTNSLRTTAKVQSNDPSYAKLAESYKPVPGMTTNLPAPGSSPTGAAAPAPKAP